MSLTISVAYAPELSSSRRGLARLQVSGGGMQQGPTRLISFKGTDVRRRAECFAADITRALCDHRLPRATSGDIIGALVLACEKAFADHGAESDNNRISLAGDIIRAVRAHIAEELEELGPTARVRYDARRASEHLHG